MRSTSESQPNLSYFRENGFSHTLWRQVVWATGLAPYQIQGIPHLRGNPLTGRLPYLGAKDGILMNVAEAAKLAEKSSKGMCTFWVENNLMLLMTNPAYVYDFKLSYQKYLNAAGSTWEKCPGPAASIEETKNGLRLRKDYIHSAALLKNSSYQEMRQKIEMMGDDYVNNINPNDLLDGGRFSRKFVLLLSAKLFMGINDFNQVNSDGLLDYISTLLTGPNENSALYLLGFKDVSANSELAQIQQFKETSINALNKLLVEPHRDEILKSDNLFHSLWRMGKQKRKDEAYTAENLFPEAFFFLAGGIIVSTGEALTVLIELICRHSVVQNKLLDELQNTFQPNDAKKEEIDIDNLPYLDMVIKETLRFKCPLPIIPCKKVAEAFTFHGIHIRKGDSIVISPHINHHLASVWKDPEKFDPERFSKENEPHIPKGAYIPFGLGSRDCVGRKYGLLVLKVLAAKLFYKFEVTLENQPIQQQLQGPSLATNKMLIRLKPRVNQEARKSNFTC